jgi:hypothetical protein
LVSRSCEVTRSWICLSLCCISSLVWGGYVSGSGFLWGLEQNTTFQASLEAVVGFQNLPLLIKKNSLPRSQIHPSCFRSWEHNVLEGPVLFIDFDVFAKWCHLLPSILVFTVHQIIHFRKRTGIVTAATAASMCLFVARRRIWG